MTADRKLVDWWIRSGFEQSYPPAAYLALQEDENPNWDGAMRRVGYVPAWSNATMDLDPTLEVWRNADGHLRVDLGEHAMFFVRVVETAAFWTTLFPALRSAELEVTRTEALELQTKALVAWVRHGHGESTISEFGETLEERRRDIEACQRRRAANKPAG